MRRSDLHSPLFPALLHGYPAGSGPAQVSDPGQHSFSTHPNLRRVDRDVELQRQCVALRADSRPGCIDRTSSCFARLLFLPSLAEKRAAGPALHRKGHKVVRLVIGEITGRFRSGLAPGFVTIIITVSRSCQPVPIGYPKRCTRLLSPSLPEVEIDTTRGRKFCASRRI